MSGDDLNSHPDQKASRWAIDFRDYPLAECERRWPELIERIRTLVKPERDKKRREAHRRFWWHHGDKRPALYSSIENKEQVFAVAAVTKYVAIVRVQANQVFMNKVYVLDLPSWASFAALQCTFHDVWVRRGSSTQGETLNYTPSDYFDTYPFLHLDDDTLGSIGEKYHQFRSELMRENQEGLTGTYNRFHNAELSGDKIDHLRELHIEMDKAVSVAYGWTDIDLEHDFYETDKGVRFTISESARREVLQRLLKLNHERYEEEASAVLNQTKTTKKRKSNRAQINQSKETSAQSGFDFGKADE